MKMATYGVEATPGQVPWTGLSNTLGSGAANSQSTAGYVQFNGVSQGDDRLAKMFRNGGQTIAQFYALMYQLLGNAPGQTATKNHYRVQGSQGSPGGLQTIETQVLVNRATTAADLAAFQALLTRVVNPPSYPADLSGNGGGGKQQYAGGW